MRFIFLTCAFVLFSSIIVHYCAHASGKNFFLVSGSVVNLRKGPDKSYDVIDKLKRGTLVAVFDLKGEWANVFYLKEGERGSDGWIHTRYLVNAPTFEEDELEDDIISEERIDPSEASVEMSVSNTNFECEERIFGQGFDRCTLEVHYSVSSDYDGELDVSVDCTAYFLLYYEDSYYGSSETERDSDSTTLEEGSGSGTVKITIEPSRFKTLKRAKVTNISCAASNDS